MKSSAGIKRYPPIFSTLLLNLPEDGTPFTLTVSSNAAAVSERLAFYNFLKFCRRHPQDCGHFNNRENRVVITVRENTITFFLRQKSSTAELTAAFNAAIRDDETPVADPSLAMDVASVTELFQRAETEKRQRPSELDIILGKGGPLSTEP